MFIEYIIENIVGSLPYWLTLGLFISWIIWAKHFNGGKFKFDNDIEKVINFLRIFFVITTTSILIISTPILLFLISKTRTTEALRMLDAFQNYLLMSYFFILFFIVISEYKKEEVEHVLLNFIVGVPIFFLFMTVAVYYSAYSSIASTYFGAFLISFAFTGLCVILISSLYDRNNYHLNYTKKELTILILFIISIISLALFSNHVVFPKTTIISEDKEYIISDIFPNTIYIQKQINHSIDSLGIKTILTEWIPLNYNDIEIENIPNNHFNRWTDIIFYYNNNTVHQISLSKYIDDKKFINGLRYIENSESTNELIFEIDRSKLKDVKIIALTGLKEVENDYKKFKIKQYDDNLKNEQLIKSTTKFTNNFALPVRFDNILIRKMDNVVDSISNCDLETVDLNIDNNLKTISCNGGFCSFDYDYQNNHYFGQIFLHDKVLVMLNTNKFQFNKFDLEINVSCN